MNAKEIKGKRVSIIGAARSGVAAAQLLMSNGARVFVSDQQSAAKLQTQISNMQSAAIDYEAGGHTARVYDADLIVTSPGVPTNSVVLQEGLRRGITVHSELEVASWFCRAPILAVTGSNGKTTTTTLLGRMFADANRKHVVAGNIGTPFSSVVSGLDENSVAVVEVSSFQLDHIESFHPKVSILLNITPDHLDRYNHSFEEYTASKCRVFMNQTNDDYLIYNIDDEVTREQIFSHGQVKARLLPFGCRQESAESAFVANNYLVTNLGGNNGDIVLTDDISIKGIHNLYNAMAATLAAQLMRINVPSIRATLRNFKGVEHRLEFVREVNGVRYINDSKATNVASVWYALQAFGQPIVLLLGGRDKGNDYAQLYSLVARNVKAIVAVGESAEKVVREFSSRTTVVKASSMQEAVQQASGLAQTGDIVLLSPACASFDWFENYEHRGKVFKQMVEALSIFCKERC